MSESLPSVKQWQRNRALLLHREFTALAGRMQHEGVFLSRGVKALAKQLKGAAVQAGVKVSRRSGVQERVMKPLRFSYATLIREWYRWNANGTTPDALLLNYKAGLPKIPELLIAEIQRRCTLPTGGRERGLAPVAAIYEWLRSDFAEGKPIPGINYDDFPAGAEFPYAESTIRNYAPAPSARALGNRGFAAFKARACHVTMDYSRLRKCELFMLDDVRLDLLCVQDWSGDVTEVRCYILMEVASRSIVAFILKPKDAIKGEDVDELLAHGLQTPGFGIGVGYTTYIKFERGNVPCTKAAQTMLEGVTEGRIQIIRTGMNGGVTWTGAPRDRAVGNFAGKAVIESFMRRLHTALLHLPGQIGNRHENTPANVGYGSNTPGTLIHETERLAKFEVSVNRAGRRLRLQLPMLRLSQVQAAVRDAIAKHNREPGHEYADHGQFVQEEVALGVWRECEPSATPAHDPDPDPDLSGNGSEDAK
jgi:hypothetical protein